MNSRDQREAMVELQYGRTWTRVPDYLDDLNTVREVMRAVGLHNREDNALRVKWVNNLRTVVARNLPRNKVGASLATDVDLLLADAEQHTEALLRTMGKWVEITSPSAS